MSLFTKFFGRGRSEPVPNTMHEKLDTRPLSSPVPLSLITARSTSIAAVRLLLQSEVFSLAGGVVLAPPTSLVPSIDEELARNGRTRPGEFAAFVHEHGFGEPVLKGRLSDAQLRSFCVGFFPNIEWACCARMTEMTTYNVIIAFNAANGVHKSKSTPTTSAPRQRTEPFDTLIDGLRADGLNEAAEDINNALRVVKWPTRQSFVSGLLGELERIKSDVEKKMSTATNRAWQDSVNRIRSL